MTIIVGIGLARLAVLVSMSRARSNPPSLPARPYALLHTCLSSFLCAKFRHHHACPFHGHGIVWNLSCTGWRSPGLYPYD